MVMYSPNTSSCGYTECIISIMIGVAFSRGLVSMRVKPSIGLLLPVWAAMSSSAGSGIGSVLLRGRRAVDFYQRRCTHRDFVSGAFEQTAAGRAFSLTGHHV